MQERRKDERYAAGAPEEAWPGQSEGTYEVYCSDTDKLIGYLDDISAHGVCLLTIDQFDTRQTMSVTVKLPEAIDGHTRLSLHIRSLWSCRDDEKEMFRTGCHVVNLPASQAEVFENLLAQIAERARANMAEELS